MLGKLALKKAFIQEYQFSASFSKLSNSKPHYFFTMISSNVTPVHFWEDNVMLKNSFYGTISFQLALFFFLNFQLLPDSVWTIARMHLVYVKETMWLHTRSLQENEDFL